MNSIRNLQDSLHALNLYCAKPDATLNADLIEVVKSYQSEKYVTGIPDQEFVDYIDQCYKVYTGFDAITAGYSRIHNPQKRIERRKISSLIPTNIAVFSTNCLDYTDFLSYGSPRYSTNVLIDMKGFCYIQVPIRHGAWAVSGYNHETKIRNNNTITIFLANPGKIVKDKDRYYTKNHELFLGDHNMEYALFPEVQVKAFNKTVEDLKKVTPLDVIFNYEGRCGLPPTWNNSN